MTWYNTDGCKRCLEPEHLKTVGPISDISAISKLAGPLLYLYMSNMWGVWQIVILRRCFNQHIEHQTAWRLHVWTALVRVYNEIMGIFDEKNVCYFRSMRFRHRWRWSVAGCIELTYRYKRGSPELVLVLFNGSNYISYTTGREHSWLDAVYQIFAFQCATVFAARKIDWCSYFSDTTTNNLKISLNCTKKGNQITVVSSRWINSGFS